jgi:hypothetical protein
MARRLSPDDPMTLDARAAFVRQLADAASDPFAKGKLLRLEQALLDVAWLIRLTRRDEDTVCRS